MKVQVTKFLFSIVKESMQPAPKPFQELYIACFKEELEKLNLFSLVLKYVKGSEGR